MRPTEPVVGKRQGAVSRSPEGKDKPADVPGDVPLRDVVLLDKIPLVPFLTPTGRVYRGVRESIAAATILPTSTHWSRHGSWSWSPETACPIGFHGEATAAEMDNVDRLPA